MHQYDWLACSNNQGNNKQKLPTVNAPMKKNKKISANQILFKPFNLNPRPTGTPDFPSPTGGGGVWTPRLSRLLLVVEKNGKKLRKLVKNDCGTIFSQFFAQVKIVGKKNG